MPIIQSCQSDNELSALHIKLDCNNHKHICEQNSSIVYKIYNKTCKTHWTGCSDRDECITLVAFSIHNNMPRGSQNVHVYLHQLLDSQTPPL